MRVGPSDGALPGPTASCQYWVAISFALSSVQSVCQIHGLGAAWGLYMGLCMGLYGAEWGWVGCMQHAALRLSLSRGGACRAKATRTHNASYCACMRQVSAGPSCMCTP